MTATDIIVYKTPADKRQVWLRFDGYTAGYRDPVIQITPTLTNGNELRVEPDDYRAEGSYIALWVSGGTPYTDQVARRYTIQLTITLTTGARCSASAQILVWRTIPGYAVERPQAPGAQGPQGRFPLTAYTLAPQSRPPTRPNSGTYRISTGVFVPPNGWTAEAGRSDTLIAWQSTRILNPAIESDDLVALNTGWSTPIPLTGSSPNPDPIPTRPPEPQTTRPVGPEPEMMTTPAPGPEPDPMTTPPPGPPEPTTTPPPSDYIALLSPVDHIGYAALEMAATGEDATHNFPARIIPEDDDPDNRYLIAAWRYGPEPTDIHLNLLSQSQTAADIGPGALENHYDPHTLLTAGEWRIQVVDIQRVYQLIRPDQRIGVYIG